MPDPRDLPENQPSNEADDPNQPTIPYEPKSARKDASASQWDEVDEAAQRGEEIDDYNRSTVPYHPNDPRYHEPPPDDDPTDEFDPRDQDLPFRLPNIDDLTQSSTVDRRNDAHKMITMPVFREPGTVDPRQTLPGSGGLDPNPDMRPPAERTVPHMPAVPSPQPRHDEQYTMPNPELSTDRRHQRPGQPGGPILGQGAYMPPPPPGASAAVRPLPKRAKRRRILGLRPGCLYMMLGLLLSFCGGITLITGTAAAVFIPRIEERWESEIARVDDYRAFQSTFLYDRNGELLFESFTEGRRTSVPYERFPAELILATIAIEDSGYFSNIGIDIPATTVAFLAYLGAAPDDNTPGGSTITQQLVRNVLFDFEKRAERSPQRKIEEIILALLLTQRKSKEEILGMYLNEIYYGNLAYGAQTASQTLFGKNVENLTLGEAAMLAGLPQAPADLDPLNPDPAVQNRVYARQRQVLNEMVDDGFITVAERDAALREGLAFQTPTASFRAPHFTVYAQNELNALMNELGYTAAEVARGGFRVYTTVDLNIDDMAREVARNQVLSLANNRVTNGAVVVLKPLTGEILSMVGSVDYNNDAIDGRVNVTIAQRQPGSTVKAFTYAAAMERGMTPGDVIWDTPTDIGIPGQAMYTPRNYDNRFHGPMTMRTALANSYNIPAVQTLRLAGVDYLLEFMRRFGVQSLSQDASQYGLSLTLGGGEMTLLELTNGYAVMANQGAYLAPTAILCIVNSEDRVIYQYENGCPQDAGRFDSQTVDRTGYGRQVLDPRLAYIITDILSDNAARSEAMGANSPLRTPNIESAAKTGTTNDIKDNWTVGYTRNVAVGVWVGNNDGTPMASGTSGLTGAAPIWNAVISRIYENPAMRNQLAVGGQLLPDKPNPPNGMSQRQICNVRRITDPSPGCPQQMTEWFLDGVAGIPDQNGNLNFPQVAPNPNQGSSTLQEISPDVYRALVFPLPPEIANGISIVLNPGDKQPMPPQYCRVSAEQANASPQIQDLVFVAGPSTSQGDWVEAERYARSNGLAILPNIDCWPDVFSATAQVFQPGVVTALISSPVNGQVVTGNIPIMGTAIFDGQADYYHLYIQGGPFTDLTALGQPHGNSVNNGQLETLFAEGLPSGNYRLVLGIKRGADFVQQPYEVVFTVP